MKPWYYFPFELIVDAYWCFIPYRCRECDYLKQCRKSLLIGRKCRNGCIEYKELYKKVHQLEREEYLDNLVKYVEEQEKK